MKEPMEQHFRDIFKEHELPYEPAAWDELSKKLDMAMPTSQSKGNWKWYLSAGIILLSALGLYWKLNLKTSPKKNKIIFTTSSEEKTTGSPVQNPVLTNDESGRRNLINKNQNHSSTEESFTPSSELTTSSYGSNQKLMVDEQRSGQKIDKNSTEEYQIHQNNPNQETKDTEFTIVYPEIKDLCEGESIWIKNENPQDLFITDNAKVYPISAGKRINFSAENPGSYYFGHAVDGKILYSRTPDFKVKENVKADFEIDTDTKFERGIPTISLQAIANENATYTWKIEGSKTELKGKEVKAHLYRKGNYEVILTAEPKDNGCPTTVRKKVQIDEDYNLLAVNSFWPNSPNPKNATFMPYALNERNVDFTLSIFDPSNGVTLFETSDATNGWTGINKTNGQLVEANKAFVWVVRIKNPLPDEKAEYKGTIVRLP
jgi:hypothetical protein